VALLFVVVTLGGSIVHACEGQHAAHVHKVAALHDRGVTADVDAHHDHTQPADREGSGHPCCADLQCHVGSVVMSAVCTAIVPLPKTEALTIPDEFGEDVFLVSLDRPPRLLVQN
jgi:hypothetical protein